ncbi:MAG TPA: glycerophosphodiester phosphodiesterase [Candidimonas sp.]|nr:glycerophosphodiester phosphodiesterase [Candidimonas sp.]
MQDTSGSWRWPKLIAHRGAGRDAPENTLASIRLGARHGFTMMEYDVKLTKDGIAVLLHDDTVDRTSNGTGLAAEKTLAELATLDFGAWHSRDYAGEPIPTLHTVAACTIARGIHSNIEVKPTAGTDAHTGTQVARLARRLWANVEVPPLLSSFSEVALDAAGREAPELPRALLIEKDMPPGTLERAKQLGCIGVNLNHQHTSLAVVEAVRAAGLTLAIWTVNDLARAEELLRYGCNAIVTDNINTIRPSRLA